MQDKFEFVRWIYGGPVSYNRHTEVEMDNDIYCRVLNFVTFSGNNGLASVTDIVTVPESLNPLLLPPPPPQPPKSNKKRYQSTQSKSFKSLHII